MNTPPDGSNPTDRHRRDAPRRGAVGRGMFVSALVLAVGCGAKPNDTVFDEITRLPDREQLVEVQLGSFTVPVPIVLESATERFEADNLMQIEFDLFAVVDPDHVKKLEQVSRRNEGRIRDRVIRVCRNSTRDALIEAEWATLKAHLLDAINPLLGGVGVNRLGATKIVKDEL